MEPLSKIIDVFFNGRPAQPEKRSNVTIAELVQRGTSHVLHGGKLYRVTVEEIDKAALKAAGARAAK